MSNTNYGGARSDTLLMDFDIYNQRRIGMLSAVEKLEFDTRPAQMEGKVCGTEAIMELMSQWNRVAKTSMNFRDFYMGCVDPSLRETADSINTTNDQVANALNIFGNPTSAIKNIQGKDTLYEMLAQQKNGDVDTVTGLENADAKDYLQLAALKAAASNVTKLKAKIFASDKEAAEYLDSQMKVLCDDDDSNDAEAIVNINATLQGFLHEEVVGGKRYVAYDQEKILGTLKYLEKDGLAHQLLSSVNAQIDANKRNGVAVPDAITELGLGGRFENTKFEARKDGAGVRLVITSNNDMLPLNEIKNKPIAYAATEESAKNYFMNGKEYDWDAIKAWYNAGNDFKDNYHERSIEYDVLAFEINNMSDKEVEELINSATTADYNHTINNSSRKYTILADRYMLQMQGLRQGGSQAQSEILGYTGKEFENKYTRAVLIKNISDWLYDLPTDRNYPVTISYERSDFDQKDYDEECGDRVYTASIKNCENCFFHTMNPEEALVTQYIGQETITVYPYGEYSDIQDKILGYVYVTAKSMSTSVSKECEDFVVSQTIGYLLSKQGDSAYFTYAITSELFKLAEIYESEDKLQSIDEARDLSSAVHSMMIKGSSVYVSGKYVQSFCVYEPDYDDKRLVFNVAAYNKTHETKYTIAQMKEEFQNNSEVFQDYNDWYMKHGDEEAYNLIVDITPKLDDEGLEIQAMSAQEIEDYLLGN